MTPKQRRLQNYNKHKKIIKVKKYVFAIILIAGFIKLLSLGLQAL